MQRNKLAHSSSLDTHQKKKISLTGTGQDKFQKKSSGVSRGLISTHLSTLGMEVAMLLLILLVILIFGFGYGGYRMGPGYGYYGGGGISLILVIVLILLLTKVI
jgi:hypothetical protein